MNITDIREHLFELQDIEYKTFHQKLMPTIDADLIIGVRTPILRQYAAQLAKHPQIEIFLKDLPHHYYEENNLHGFIIEGCKDFERTIQLLDEFLPFVDNWATCDMVRPKCFKKYPEETLQKIREWMHSEYSFTVRFGIETMMRFYLGDHFQPQYLEEVGSIRSEEYYVNMMIAWFFATALAKQWDATIPYIEEKKLDPWVHNKTIQKARESYMITPKQKEFLKKLKNGVER